jgi:hypothetical protein
MISKKYPHRFGDYDYTTRATKNNIKILTPAPHLGTCLSNPPEQLQATTWAERLLHPLQLDAKAYLQFLLHHNPSKLPLGVIKVLAKASFPNIYKITQGSPLKHEPPISLRRKA